MMMPYLEVCRAFAFPEMESSKQAVWKEFLGLFLERCFPRLSRSIWWDVISARWLWKILRAKLGEDRLLKVLIRTCAGAYDLAGVFARLQFVSWESECDQNDFIAWVNKKPRRMKSETG